nr:hypothetical protein [Rhodopseudomonas palustris]
MDVRLPDSHHSAAPKSAHMHIHGADSPHPMQPPPWSILRMTLAARLTAAIAISAVLWAIVLLAMR